MAQENLNSLAPPEASEASIANLFKPHPGTPPISITDRGVDIIRLDEDGTVTINIGSCFGPYLGLDHEVCVKRVKIESEDPKDEAGIRDGIIEYSPLPVDEPDEHSVPGDAIEGGRTYMPNINPDAWRGGSLTATKGMRIDTGRQVETWPLQRIDGAGGSGMLWSNRNTPLQNFNVKPAKERETFITVDIVDGPQRITFEPHDPILEIDNPVLFADKPEVWMETVKERDCIVTSDSISADCTEDDLRRIWPDYRKNKVTIDPLWILTPDSTCEIGGKKFKCSEWSVLPL